MGEEFVRFQCAVFREEVLLQGVDFKFDYGHDYGYLPEVIVSKGKLKSKMLEYFREVERTGEPLIVTDHGRQVLEVRPVVQKKLSMAEALEWYRGGGTFDQKCSDEELMSAGESWEKLSDDTDLQAL